MYVCQKKSVDGGKTWGNLTYPFGREIATREASPVYDFINDKLGGSREPDGLSADHGTHSFGE